MMTQVMYRVKLVEDNDYCVLFDDYDDYNVALDFIRNYAVVYKGHYKEFVDFYIHYIIDNNECGVAYHSRVYLL